ncbi:MAG: MBL fold metallo-hydrolase [Proteobacteria bacterium]|nr:MBL fold metallo-hydrolase [Pseudomonadota bacterium]
MGVELREVDRVDILTLQDNYVDLASGDSNAMVQRALPIKGREIKNSILAEHGFSAVITAVAGEDRGQVLFDFGYSEHGAAFNADALGLDMTGIGAMALSHGHFDHVGGLAGLTRMIGRPGIDLIVHPSVFKVPRFVKITEEFKLYFPPFTREQVQETGVHPVETREPMTMLDGAVLFLGEIPRKTEFEKGMPNAYFEEGGAEKWDPIEDDTALVLHVKGRGLVVLSGCAHSGIVNTVRYAREVTGVEPVFAVMGGFHLTGPAFEPIIGPTTEALKEIGPTYVIPTHCTGRKAVMHMEKEMPDRFIMNMSGTNLIFSS